MSTKIHTTVGVYRSNDFKTNGVAPEHLEDHIEYNLKMRPGRALFVDGVCKNQGYLSDEQLADWTERVKVIKVDHCTVPYH